MQETEGSNPSDRTNDSSRPGHIGRGFHLRSPKAQRNERRFARPEGVGSNPTGRARRQGADVADETKAPRNEVAVRSTEGPRSGEPAPESRKRRGRPAGSKNKPKALVPKELANEILLVMKDQLPPEHFEYMKGVIMRGEAISTKQELDILILLLNRNLAPALVSEMTNTVKDEATGKDLGPVMRKDVTERLKVLKSLLDLRHNIERREEKTDDDENNPVLKLWASRNLQGRVAILVNGVTPDDPAAADGGHSHPALPASGAAGDDDGVGRGTDEA